MRTTKKLKMVWFLHFESVTASSNILVLIIVVLNTSLWVLVAFVLIGFRLLCCVFAFVKPKSKGQYK